MLCTELTSDDRIWLAQQAEALRLSCDFMLHDLFHQEAPSLLARASIVPIWFGDKYVPASTVLRHLEASVPYSQIFEQWQARVYHAVETACRGLSMHDARVLWVAAGFHTVTEAEIYDAAGEAVQEAWDALYGEPDGSFDEDGA